MYKGQSYVLLIQFVLLVSMPKKNHMYTLHISSACIVIYLRIQVRCRIINFPSKFIYANFVNAWKSKKLFRCVLSVKIVCHKRKTKNTTK